MKNLGLNKKSDFSESSVPVKLSAVVFGLGNVVYGQIVKGLLFFALECVFVAYMILSGFGDLKGLVTLGTKTQQIVIDPITGIPSVVAGDNSMLFLLKGGIAVVFIVAFLLLARASLSSAIETEKTVRRGKKPLGFIEDVKELWDSHIARTLLFIPLLGLLAFTVIPLVFMILIAFTNYDSYHQPPQSLFEWVGLSNFKDLLNFSGRAGQTFGKVTLWTLVWAFFATFTCYFGGILLAILINKKEIRFKAVWRTIFVLTIAIPNFVTLLTVRTMLQPHGVVNIALQNMGFTTKPLPFFSNANWSRATLIIVNMWIGIPVTMLFSTGVLQNIPGELYESAMIDGANPVVMFVRITMPYVFFMTSPVLITNFTGNINNFNAIFFLSQGKPLTLDYFTGAGQTDLLVTWLYNLTMNSSDFSYASAIGIIIFVFSAFFSLIFFRKSKMFLDTGDFKQ